METPPDGADRSVDPGTDAPVRTDGGATPEAAQIACFEAGIKFGSLYHQFAGTPVSPASAADLATAMESSIENQPFCEAVSVSIDEDAVAAAADEEFGYAELTGRFLTVELTVVHEGVTVRARMAMEGSYPHMRLVSVERA